jgi:hypothetical protein
MKRNLIFFCYPHLCGNWRRSVAHLRACWSVFSGRKLVTIAVDACCDAAEYAALFFPPDAEITLVNNVRLMQETAHFRAMLDEIQSTDPDECTTYAHAKGATHADPLAPSHQWCDAMAEATLYYPDLIKCALARAAICGAFRTDYGWEFDGYHNWHFAGTWYTFRHDATFDGSIDWRNIGPTFYGVEAWPGLFPPDRSFCLFFDHADTNRLYQPEFWRETIGPSLGYWRASLAGAGAARIGNQSAASAAATVDS